jgi:hypothetical protein
MQPDQLYWLPAGATPEMLAADARGRHACERRSQGCVLLARHRRARRIWISLRLRHLGAQRPEVMKKVANAEAFLIIILVHACFGSHASPSGQRDLGAHSADIGEARAGAQTNVLRCVPERIILRHRRRLDSLHEYARARARQHGPAMPLGERSSTSVSSRHGSLWHSAWRGSPPEPPPPPPPPDDSNDDQRALPLSALRGGAWPKGRNATSHKMDWHTWWTETDWYVCLTPNS